MMSSLWMMGWLWVMSWFWVMDRLWVMDRFMEFVMEEWLLMVRGIMVSVMVRCIMMCIVQLVPNVVLIMMHVFKLMRPGVLFKVVLESMMFMRIFLMVRRVTIVVLWLYDFMVRQISVIVVVCWFGMICVLVIANFMVWHIIVVVVSRLSVTFLMRVMVCVIVKRGADSIKHVVGRWLDRVVWIMMDWLSHHSLMVSLWIDVVVRLVVDWVL